MEVFPSSYCFCRWFFYFLHVCGGVSLVHFPPLMLRSIFSTYVEVFLRPARAWFVVWYFLHVCGGVSQVIGSKPKAIRFSPRMWRCFLGFVGRSYRGLIFSTYVEVFPTDRDAVIAQLDFLHVCGGVSHKTGEIEKRRVIFSTYVEVFLCKTV